MFKLLLFVSFLQLLLGLEDSLDDRYGTNCRRGPIELGILLDCSVTSNASNFRETIDFVQDYLKSFDIDSGNVRVALISYGRDVHTESSFNLTTFQTKESVIWAVGRIHQGKDNISNTGEAIDYMHRVQMAPTIVRKGVEKTILVITNRDSPNWQITRDNAHSARKKKVNMLAVGADISVHNTELRRITGDNAKYFMVQHFKHLPSILGHLIGMTCVGKRPPENMTASFKNTASPSYNKTTSPPYKKTTSPPKACKQTDVYFVFSPVSLGQQDITWAVSFISSVITNRHLRLGFRFSVISDSCPKNDGFGIDAYTVLRQYQDRLQAYNYNRVGKQLKCLLDKPGRKPTKMNQKFAVIVASPGDLDDANVADYVSQLNKSGFQVVIPNPHGNKFFVEGATILTSGTADIQSEQLNTLICPK